MLETLPFFFATTPNDSPSLKSNFKLCSVFVKITEGIQSSFISLTVRIFLFSSSFKCKNFNLGSVHSKVIMSFKVIVEWDSSKSSMFFRFMLASKSTLPCLLPACQKTKFILNMFEKTHEVTIWRWWKLFVVC